MQSKQGVPLLIKTCRDGNRVRVTTELVDARTDQTLWSDSFDRDLTDIFAIQSEIAQTVVAKLSARMSPEEKQLSPQPYGSTQISLRPI
jgi:TolB-like protein